MNLSARYFGQQSQPLLNIEQSHLIHAKKSPGLVVCLWLSLVCPQAQFLFLDIGMNLNLSMKNKSFYKKVF